MGLNAATRLLCRTLRLRLLMLMLMLLGFWVVPPGVKAVERPAAPIEFMQPGGVPPQPLLPTLPKSDVARLADRWITLIDPADPVLAGGAIDLLEHVPAPLADAIAQRLAATNALNKLFAKAPDALKDRIRNSIGIDLARLRGFATSAIEADMKSAIAAGAGSAITAMIASTSGYRSVPPRLMDIILSGLESPGVQGQGRDSLVAMVLAHPGDTRYSRARLLRWVQPKPDSTTNQQNRDTALTVLLQMDDALDERLVAESLGSDDFALKRAASRRLRRDGATLSNALQTRLAALLRQEVVHEDWVRLRDILRQKAPGVLNDAYSASAAASIRQQWPAEIAAEWLRNAPAAYLAQMSRLPLELYTPAEPGTLRTCEILRYQIAVLRIRALRKQSSLADFWETIVKSPHSCRDPLATDLDDYLSSAAALESPERVLGDLAGSGLHQLADWHTGSTRLARSLAPAAAARVVAGDVETARSYVSGWITPDPALLAQARYWDRAIPTTANVAEIHFRVLQAVRDAPTVAYANAVVAARSEKLEDGVREAALLALAAGNRTGAQLDLFLDLLYANAPVAQTAARLLALAYDRQQIRPHSYAPRKRQFFVDALTHVMSPGDVWNLLARLSNQDRTAAVLFAEENWSREPARTCFVFADDGALALDVGLPALNAAAAGEAAAGQLRACVALLAAPDTPMSYLAHNWTQIRQPGRQDALTVLRQLWAHGAVSDSLRNRLAGVASMAAGDQSWSPAGRASLQWWLQNVASVNAPAAATFETEYEKRRYASYVLAVPVTVAVHLLLWTALLTCYTTSPRVQAIVFWNPKVRKLLGAGYIDALLHYIPLARRRLFAPFAREFLRDICDSEDIERDLQGYFEGSYVLRRTAQDRAGHGARDRITIALREHRGRVLLQGKSGLGKSRFLRYWLALRALERKDVIVYLRADQCRSGVETEIERRMQGVGSDEKLLRSMIYSGRIYVYIDGYNEVDLATQEQITAFVADHPHGNIMVTSQIPLRGLSAIDTFELLPLDREQIREFLGTRTSILPDDAPVRADSFDTLAQAFLDDVWERQADEAQIRAMGDILANPMDLTSVAMLLSQGRVPDLFALENQQLEAAQRHLRAQDLEFRVVGFSKALLEQRLKDQENLEVLPFAPEVAELLTGKLAQIRTFSDPGMKATVQEIRFRHDRIRDFFSHFSMLEMTPEQQASYAADARFAGVFPYLARSMPSGSAELLRERLVSLAAELEDHRVSDSFVREFSWRKRVTDNDPDWVLAYDTGSTRDAEERFTGLLNQRSQLDRELIRLRDVIAHGRRYVRLVTTADNTELVQLGKEVLEVFGALEDAEQSPTGPTLRSPHGHRFVLLAIAQRDHVRTFHVDLLLARLRHVQERVLVIVNSQVASEPDERSGDADVLSMLRRVPAPLAVVQSASLYMMYKNFVDGDRAVVPWNALARQWAGAGSHAEGLIPASEGTDRSII